MNALEAMSEADLAQATEHAWNAVRRAREEESRCVQAWHTLYCEQDRRREQAAAETLRARIRAELQAELTNTKP